MGPKLVPNLEPFSGLCLNSTKEPNPVPFWGPNLEPKLGTNFASDFSCFANFGKLGGSLLGPTRRTNLGQKQIMQEGIFLLYMDGLLVRVGLQHVRSYLD